MSFKQILLDACANKTRILINGMGSGTTKGTILEVFEDYITYELLEVEVEKNTKKEKTTKEIKMIPISAITEISEGEKETTKNPVIQALQV